MDAELVMTFYLPVVSGELQMISYLPVVSGELHTRLLEGDEIVDVDCVRGSALQLVRHDSVNVNLKTNACFMTMCSSFLVYTK